MLLKSEPYQDEIDLKKSSNIICNKKLEDMFPFKKYPCNQGVCGIRKSKRSRMDKGTSALDDF